MQNLERWTSCEGACQEIAAGIELELVAAESGEEVGGKQG